jgi:probable F420-dependent oxidoreductase
MTHPLNLGLYLLSPAEVTGVERALWAEQRGFSSVWVPDGEGSGQGERVHLALAVRTGRIRIGLGVVPVFTHTPAVLASAAMTLAHLAPGRIVLGLGTSSENMMEGWHGIPFEKPLTRMRETTQVLRRMLMGERVEFQGETLHTRAFKLNPAPETPVPIYLAALRPKMLELAGEVADGVILHLAPLTALPRMLEHVAAGAARSGRTLADLEIVCRFNAIVMDDDGEAREATRDFVQRYLTAPVYNRFFAWCGFEREATEFYEAFRARDRARSRAAVSDALVEQMCIFGNEEQVREKIRAYAAAGIRTPAINAFAPDLPTAQRTMEAFLPEHFA